MRWLLDTAFLGGCALIAAGAWLVSTAAGLIVAGALLVIVALLASAGSEADL